jgi:peptidase M28-like protein/fibronectin type III domain protein/Big-like domain-containing protein
MSNYLSLSLVALLLWSETAAKESFAGPTSPPNSSASLTSQPLLDPVILRMLDRVDANRIAADIQTLVSFGTRNTCSDNSGASRGIGAARDWIRNRYLSLPGLQVRLVPWTMEGCGDGTTRTLQDVIAWIPGKGHPNRLIVIGGHYDSRTTNVLDGISPAPGANDSGSQTALVLEAARVMAGHRFDATVVFANWSGEEQGLLGSKYFVQHCLNYFPNGTLEFNLNFDDVGGDNVVNDATSLQQFDVFSPGTPREFGFAPNGSTDDTSPSRGVMRQIGYWGNAYVPSMTMLPQLRESPLGRQSDQTAFIASGIPGVRFRQVNMNPPHRHSPYDLYIYCTPAFTARLCEVIVASAASVARAPTPPLNMVASGTSSGTLQFTWSPPLSGSPVHHYVISARTSRENLYRTRVVVPRDLTSATVDVFQDLGIPAATAYYVSIAAVDAAGHESLYAYPEYRCDYKNRCSQPANALNVTAIATPPPALPALRGLTYNGGMPFADGTILTKGTSYTVTAQANSNTQSVVFTREGGVVLGIDSAFPFDVTWTPTILGTHTLTVTPWSSAQGKGTRGPSIRLSYYTVSAQ